MPGKLWRRRVPTPATRITADCETGDHAAVENFDDNDAPSSKIIQEEDDSPAPLEHDENNNVEGSDADHENSDLESLLVQRYVHDEVPNNENDAIQRLYQYQAKDGVAIRLFDGWPLLPSSSLSFIVASDPCGETRSAFYIAWLVWCFQIVLLALLFYDNIVTRRERYDNSNIFGLDVETNTFIIVSKFIATFLMVVKATDIPEAYSQMFRGYDARRAMFEHAFPNTKKKKLKWHLHNQMRLVKGAMGWFSGLILILQQNTVGDLLLSFPTLTAVTSLDDIAFTLCSNGFLGRSARTGAINIATAKYNYDAYKLPSFTICGYDLTRSATRWQLDSKIRLLTMIFLVLMSWLRTWDICVVNQLAGSFRCSQKIIDESLYNVAKDFCSERKTFRNTTSFVLISEGEESISDVPFVVAVRQRETPSVSWTIRDLTMQKLERGPYGNIFEGKTDASVNGFGNVYLYYTCLPHDFNGIWSIERRGQDDSNFFLGLSEIYKIKSELPIDGYREGEEICVDNTQVYSLKRGSIQQSHVIGDLFRECAHEITFEGGECNEEYNAVDCAYDGLRCLSEEHNNTLSKQNPNDSGIGEYVSLINPVAIQEGILLLANLTLAINEEVEENAQSPT